MSPDQYLMVGKPAPGRTDEGIWSAIYADASAETGRTEEELRTMAIQVFATILFHMLQERGSVIWTAARLENSDSGRFSVEVNILPRFRAKP